MFAQNLVLIFAYIVLMQKVNLDIIYASINILCKILFRVSPIQKCLQLVISMNILIFK